MLFTQEKANRTVEWNQPRNIYKKCGKLLHNHESVSIGNKEFVQ